MNPDRRLVSRPLAVAAGVLAAGLALGTSELVVGARGPGPSLVTAVGSEFIDRYAASLKDLAVSLFGTNDKAALVVGIVVVSLALGGLLGAAAATRRWVGGVGMATFGVVGWWAYQRSPLGDGLTGTLAALAAVGVGAAALHLLLEAATTPPPGEGLVLDGVASPSGVQAAAAGPMGRAAAPRRVFLVGAGVVGVGAAATAALGRRLHASGATERARQAVQLPPAATVPRPVARGGPASAVPGITPYLTPNDDFFRIDTALVVPTVDLDAWRLAVTGLVERPFSLSYDELLAMPSVEEVVTLQCVSNAVGGDLVGNATWQGVPLAALLERAGVRPEAGQVVGRSVDRFSAGFPLEATRDGRIVLVAYAMNGEPLPADHGFPARLVVAGLYGYVSATKWLSEVELTTWDGFDGYWISRGWSKEGPVKPMSRLDVPRAGEIGAGPTAVAGVAWAPTGGVSGVEVRVDDGPWLAAELGDAVSGSTWVQWHLVWEATPGEHQLSVRAIDAEGRPQTGEVASPAPDGATGWHTRRVRVRAD